MKPLAWATALPATIAVSACSPAASPDPATLRPWFDGYVATLNESDAKKLAEYASNAPDVAADSVARLGGHGWTVTSFTSTNPTETMYTYVGSLTGQRGEVHTVKGTAIWTQGKWTGGIYESSPATPGS